MKNIRRVKFACCLMLCVSLFMAACSKDGTPDNDTISDNEAILSEGSVSHITDGREWVYVPEVIMVGDERADYERMQPVGDTFCYVSLGGEDENSVRSICRYSLTNRELTTVSIDWPEGGNN